MDVKGKLVTVVGAGRSGRAAAVFLQRQGARVQVSERGAADTVEDGFRSWAASRAVVCEFGGHSRPFLEQTDLVILSPGVRRDDEPVRWAEAAGVPVISEIELGFQHCPCPVIAVTGSNGKTTVSTLIHDILAAAGRKVRLCGNIGVPFCAVLDDLQDADYAVLEVSSFQMETITTFRPRVAVLTNFSQNHLDRHKDLEEYFTAKTRIFMNQEAEDVAVLNAADPSSPSLAGRLKGRVVWFNTPEQKGRNPNHLAAEAVCGVVGIPAEIVRQVCSAFRGVEHRMEVVRELDGVMYINDSKATTAESGRWALERMDRPVIMICGGRDKHIDFSPLAPLVKGKVKKMIIIGEARQKLREVFGSVTRVEEAETLDAAVALARHSAAAGDCVLLSPMCASFDMFKNFEDRGRVFKSIVASLTAASGT